MDPDDFRHDRQTPRLAPGALVCRVRSDAALLCTTLLPPPSTAQPLGDPDLQILSLCDGTREVREIAAELSLPPTTVCRVLERWRKAIPGVLLHEESSLARAARRWAEKTISQWRAATEPTTDNTSYHQHDSDSPTERFEIIETTVSHAFRKPHAALSGRTYGQTLCDVLVARGAVGRKILEVGGGTGYLALDFLNRLAATHPDAYATVEYSMLDLSPTLREAQAQACWVHKPLLAHLAGDIESFDFRQRRFDLLIANEMIADLRVGAASRDNLCVREPRNEAEELILRYRLSTPTVLPQFAVNVGALRVIERLPDILAPGGFAVMTEHGAMDQPPRLLELRGHHEYSIHFRNLLELAKALGLDAEVVSLGEFLKADGDCEVVSTDSLRALNHALLPALNRATIPRLSYDRPNLRRELGELWPHVHNIQFRQLRVGGFMSPFGFQALIVRMPA